MATQRRAKLRIGLDLRPTEEGFKAHAGRGTGRYANELVRHLLAAQDAEGLPFELVPLRSAQFSSAPWEQHLLQSLPFGRLTFESQVLYPRRVQRAHVDLAHFFAHGDASARPVVPQLITVLDVIPLRFPHLYKADKPNWRFRFARFLEYQAIRKARGLLAISEATKRDLVELLEVRPEDVLVTPLAVSSRFEEVGERQQLPTGRPYLLYVGGIDPRKNVLFLVEVFRQLLAQWRGEDRPMLVLAGAISQDDQFPALCRLIERDGLTADIHMCGFVDDDELCNYYRGAAAFVFPSLYEGFGLPVLEAMACGCPVIAGDNSSITEVAGEAAMLLPDADHRAWLQALQHVLHSADTRKQMRERGIAQARRFSWQQTAERTIAAYQHFSGQPLIRGSRQQEQYAANG